MCSCPDTDFIPRSKFMFQSCSTEHASCSAKCDALTWKFSKCLIKNKFAQLIAFLLEIEVGLNQRKMMQKKNWLINKGGK